MDTQQSVGTGIATNGVTELSAPGKLLSEAFAFYREHLRLLLPIAVLPFAINVALLFAIKAHSVVLPVLMSIVAIVVGIIVQLAFLQISLREISQPVEALRNGSRLFFQGIFIAVISGLAILGGLFLLVIPGIMIAFLLTFSSYTLVATDRRGYAALSYSWSLVRYMPKAIIWRFLFIGIVVIGVSFLLGILSAPLGKGLTSNALEQALGSFLLTPLSVMYISRLFTELRTRVPELTPEEDTRIQKKLQRLGIFGIVGSVVLAFILVFVAGVFVAQAFHMFQRIGPSGGAMILGAPFVQL